MYQRHRRRCLVVFDPVEVCWSLDFSHRDPVLVPQSFHQEGDLGDPLLEKKRRKSKTAVDRKTPNTNGVRSEIKVEV